MRVHVEHFPKSAGESGPVPLTDEAGKTVLDVLHALDVPPDSVLVLRDGAPIPLDTELIDDERLRIVWTISGG